MIDLHSHILHGLDDGAARLAQSLEIARAAVADGITGIAATPHVRDDYPTSVTGMRAAVAELREALAAEAIPLELYTGGELALGRLEVLSPEELRGFALAGGRYLLLEFPYAGWPLDLPTKLFALQTAGLVPVLGHPERSQEVGASPDRLEPLVAAGALVQVTAASVDGRLGRRTQRTATTLIERGLAHLIASDAHAPEVRAVGLGAAAAAVGAPLGSWLTRDVPAAIIADAALPPRPRSRRSPWTLRRR